MTEALVFAVVLMVACAVITAWLTYRSVIRDVDAAARKQAQQRLDAELAESTRALNVAQDEYAAMLRRYTKTLQEHVKRQAPN